MEPNNRDKLAPEPVYQGSYSSSAGLTPIALGPNRYEQYIAQEELDTYQRVDFTKSSVLEFTCRCMFQGLELSLLAALEASQDQRPGFPRQGFCDSILHESSALVSHACLLLNIPGVISAPPTLTPQPAYDTLLKRFLAGELASVSRRQIDNFTFSLASAFEGLPFGSGIAPWAQKLRANWHLSTLDISHLSYLPYDQWSMLSELLTLPHGSIPEFGPEDRRFSLIHQATESWVRIAHFAMQKVLTEANKKDWHQASVWLEWLPSFLTHLGSYINVLGYMNLSDFHPLRVALQGASGAQSRATRAIHRVAAGLIEPLQAELAASRIRLVSILQHPDLYPELSRYVSGLHGLESAVSEFFFHHYRLAARVIGSSSVGSAGKEVGSMVNRFVRPVYPMLDQARFLFHEMASLSLAREMGCLFWENDADLSIAGTQRLPSSQMTATPNQLISAIMTYFATLSKNDPAALNRLFTDNGYIEDPRGAMRWFGPASRSAYLLNLNQRFHSLSVLPQGSPVLNGNVATVEWVLRGRFCGQQDMEIRGSAEMYFSPAGLLRVVLDDWPVEELSHQIGYQKPAWVSSVFQQHPRVAVDRRT